MNVLTFNPVDLPGDIINQLRNSKNSDIILYHVGRTNEKSSLEMEPVCEFFYQLFHRISTEPDCEKLIEKLHIQSQEEMFICELANRVYKGIDIDGSTDRFAKDMLVEGSDRTVYDIVKEVMENDGI